MLETFVDNNDEVMGSNPILYANILYFSLASHSSKLDRIHINEIKHDIHSR